MSELLQQAVGDGRITLSEFSERVDEAYAAKTRSELDRVVADLVPAQPPTAYQPVPVPAAQPMTTISAILSDRRQSGPMRIDGEIRVASVMGDIHLDLREAFVATDEVVIRGYTVMGDINVLVPEGTQVDLSGTAIMADHRLRLERVPPKPGMPRVRIMVTSVMGDITVRNEKLSKKLSQRIRRAFE